MKKNDEESFPNETKKPSRFEEGIKFDQGKLRFDLIPPESLILLAAVYTAGAVKYEDRNWERGMKWSRPFGALMRHAWLWWAGKILGTTKDPESKFSHMAHASWNCFALLQYEMTHPEFDDRPSLQHKNSEFMNIMEALENWIKDLKEGKEK